MAAGCYVQTSEKEVLNDLSVDIVIGNDRKHDLVRLLEEYSLDSVNDTVDDINDGKHDFEELFIDQTKEHTRAFIKVQDGCNQFCSYCIIPYARGRVRSRAMEDIHSEVRTLAAAGYKEVVLTGIHLSSYGIDFAKTSGEQDYLTGGAGRLLNLLEAVSQVPGIARIRLGSLEPRIITEDFVERLSRIPAICPHFHLSLQSGCDETLKRMNRHYTTEEYVAACALLRRYFHDPALTTDLIAGFPGETEEDHETLMEFVDEMEFDRLGVFPYSQEEDTPAATMEDQVPQEVKEFRRDELMELQQAIAFDKAEDMVGHILTVMIEGKVADEETYVARTYRDAPNVDGYLFVNTSANLMTGDFVKVLVTGSNEYDLIGEIYHE